MTTSPITFYERVETALQDEKLHTALTRATDVFTTKRTRAIDAFPGMDEARDRARQIRAHTVAHLDQYLEQFATAFEALGGQVYWAKDAVEANKYIVDLAQVKGVKRVVKSKSMVSEETEINHDLIEASIDVIESDLGEYIIQLAGEPPSHIIAPVIHKTREQIGEVFAQYLGVPYTDEPSELNKIARTKLREIFLTADMGITGANFGVAETGSICLVMNEGNGRLTTTAPRIHVAMMGLERLVPTIADLSVMLQILARSATGQKLSVYSNIITGPRRSDEEDGPEEMHIVILDNGRSKVLGTEMAEILYCIRCGACLNACPVYREIGGHAYGSVYPGPVGAVLMPSLMGLDPWHELPHASSLCGACQEVCPVRINIPRMLLKLRQETTQAGHSPGWLKTGLKVYSQVARRPSLYRAGLRTQAWASNLVAKNGWINSLPGPLSGWTEHRAFPAFAKKSFRQQWKERKNKGKHKKGKH